VNRGPSTSSIGSPTSPAHRTSTDVVIVGGSLVGLSAAAALARRGLSVTVLERTADSGYSGGGGLGVDVDLLRAVTGFDGSPPVCQGIDRATTAWSLLAQWLETQVRAIPGVDLQRDADVVEVDEEWVRCGDGRQFRGSVVLGADGARSTTRRWVSPEQPDAVYDGVLLWRAMVPEADLPNGSPQLAPHEPSRDFYSGPYRLVVYVVPGPDGSSEPGRRRLNLVWYDPARSDLLEDHGLLRGTRIHGSLLASDVPEELRIELSGMARQRWPSPWREALDLALAQESIFGTPLVHYWPPRLVRKNVLLAGDAAHAASPMVGGGFRQGLFDVVALDSLVSADRSIDLASYEDHRLAPARAHVEHSRLATEEYLVRRNLR
jgi:2-polyprenyl-6-methoxyphenol hydroxylase-like FAD-dependent oxidoreductase